MSAGRLVVLFFLLCAVPCGVWAQQAPGAMQWDEYQENFVKPTFIPGRETYRPEQEDPAKKGGEQTIGGMEAPVLRGNIMPDTVADFDAEQIKNLWFMACNDGLINDYEKFFESPDYIPFICMLGIVGNDPNTGEELSRQMCKEYDKRGCGLHLDNRHEDIGGVVGLGIVLEVEVTDPILKLLCNKMYLTGSWVEYYMPWTLANMSRNMYQSLYLDRVFVETTRLQSTMNISLTAMQETLPSIQKWQEVVQKEMQDSGVAGAGVPAAPGAGQAQAIQQIQAATQAIMQADPRLRDLAPYSKQGFARNFSSLLDMEQIEENMWWVPHWNKDTHRFGTDLPHFGDLEKPKGKDNPLVPIPGEPQNSGNQQEKANVGGDPYGRFLSAQEKLGKKHSKRVKEYFKKFTDAGGPRICLNNNIATMKTPEDFYEHSENKAAEDYHFCMDMVGNRFAMSHYKLLHDTDSIWQSLAGGAFDQFYLLNWPQHYDAELQKGCQNMFITPFTCPIGLMSWFPTKFHTYFESLDRIRIMPDVRMPVFGGDPMPDFLIETFGKGFPVMCPTLQGPIPGDLQLAMHDYNIMYDRSNIRDVGWGAEQTAYVFGIAKGVWGFKGWPFFKGLPNGMSRAPWVYVRFS